MPLTPLPTPPSRADSANFASRADAFFAALPAFQVEFNAMLPTVVAGAVTGSFTATGNIGAGTDTPAVKIHASASGSSARLRATSTDATGATVEILADSSIAGVLSVNTNHPLIFQTDSAERARINGVGYVLVGYTSSNGAYKLQVNSQIFATSSTVATSDGRYKTNVTPLTGALAVINALRPVLFDWKPHQVHNFSTDRSVGFIAQEVRDALAGTGYGDAIVKKNMTVLPDGSDESFLGIAEGNLIAVLAAAVQELSARVAALEAAGG